MSAHRQQIAAKRVRERGPTSERSPAMESSTVRTWRSTPWPSSTARSCTTVARSAVWTPSMPEPERNRCNVTKLSTTQRSHALIALLSTSEHCVERQQRSTATTTRFSGSTRRSPLGCAAASDGPADGVVLAEPTRSAWDRDRHRGQSLVRTPRSGSDGVRGSRRSNVRNVVAVGADPDLSRATRQLLVG